MERPAHIMAALGLASLMLLVYNPGLREWHLMWGWVFAGIAGVFPDNDVKFGVHRKTLHNVFAVVFMSVLSAFVGGFIMGPEGAVVSGVAWFAGMLSHLLIDSLTYQGVAWLYPLKTKTYGLRITRFDNMLWNKVFFIMGIATSLSVALHVMGISIAEQVLIIWRAFNPGLGG